MTAEALRFGRELLRRLGYEVMERMRSPRRPGDPEELRLKTRRLGRGEAGDIADDRLAPDDFDSLRTGRPQAEVRRDRHRTRRRLERHDQQSGHEACSAGSE